MIHIRILDLYFRIYIAIAKGISTSCYLEFNRGIYHFVTFGPQYAHYVGRFCTVSQMAIRSLLGRKRKAHLYESTYWATSRYFTFLRLLDNNLCLILETLAPFFHRSSDSHSRRSAIHYRGWLELPSTSPRAAILSFINVLFFSWILGLNPFNILEYHILTLNWISGHHSGTQIVNYWHGKIPLEIYEIELEILVV